MKSRILLEDCYPSTQLKHSTGEFADYHNYRRYDESMNNFTPGVGIITYQPKTI